MAHRTAPSTQTTTTSRWGAIVAIGELYDSGRLDNKQDAAEDTRLFLESFGVRSLEDIRQLGTTDPYVEDFHTLFNP